MWNKQTELSVRKQKTEFVNLLLASAVYTTRTALETGTTKHGNISKTSFI